MARARQPTVGFGRRLRAALILAADDRDMATLKDEVAQELNVSSRTLDRMVSEDRWPSEWEIGRLSKTLDVPEWFLRQGFNGSPDEPDPVDELRLEIRNLDKKIDALDLDRRLAAIGSEVSRLADRELRR